MQFADFSPSSSPSLEEQRDALRKGLGRAVQWSIAERVNEEPLLEACLRDQRFDMECEWSRVDWLWKMIHAVGAADRFRSPILNALGELSDAREAYQLCEFAGKYAGAGDDAFRARLYEIVEQKPLEDDPTLGEEELLAIGGAEAFSFAAKVRGRRLANRDWEWDDDSFLRGAIEELGEVQVGILLEDDADEAVTRFREEWFHAKKRDAQRQPRPVYADRMKAISIDEILADAERDKPVHMAFRGWGKFADDADLQEVLDRLWIALNPTTIVNLLRVFSARALPTFDSRLIELCDHDDQRVRRWALNAMEVNKHGEIRRFALDKISTRVHGKSAIGLLTKNFQKGDEQRIIESVELPDDPCELHWLLTDVLEVLEENADADCSQLGLIAYHSTPCENCRFTAARVLLSRQAAPEWLIEECRHDSNEECRDLVEASGL